jgi:hypothetical protein
MKETKKKFIAYKIKKENLQKMLGRKLELKSVFS